MVTKREIIGLGGGTFLLVGIVSLFVIGWNFESDQHKPAPAAQVVQVKPTPTGTKPQLVELGVQPPDGVTYDSDYKRQQIEALLTKRLGKSAKVRTACEVSGSQRVEYTGNADIAGEKTTRSYSITVWSKAPIEFTSEPDDGAWSCDGLLTLVRNFEVVPEKEAQEEFADRQVEAQKLFDDAGERAALEETTRASVGEPSQAQMYGYIDRVTTYAVFIGRSAACGVNTKSYAGRVGAWVDRVAPPGTRAQQTLLTQLMQGSYYHAQQQSTGQSPDSCDVVARAVARFDWP